MNNTSKQHHFIPQFFIRGFIAPNTQLWVYDKQKDTVSLKSPKSSFFGWNRNNINLNGFLSDILENTTYKLMDDKLAAAFKKIQNGTVDDAETQDSCNHICLMIGINFHRIPAMEKQAELLTFYLINNQLPEERKGIIERILNTDLDDVDKLKMLRSAAFAFNIFSTPPLGGKAGIKVIDALQPSFILSDNPVIHDGYPQDFNELTDSCIFPLTEKRVFYGLKGNAWSMDTQIMKRINIVLALQAQQYFASSNKNFLEQIIQAFKIMQPVSGAYQSIKENLFKSINTGTSS